MPGFHVHGVICRPKHAGLTEVYNTVRPGVYRVWGSSKAALDFPMVREKVGGEFECAKTDLYHMCAAEVEDDYVAFEVYRNYGSSTDMTLDFFVRRGNYGDWTLYTLHMPPEVPAGRTIDRAYPDPTEWFLATGMTIVCNIWAPFGYHATSRL